MVIFQFVTLVYQRVNNWLNIRWPDLAVVVLPGDFPAATFDDRRISPWKIAGFNPFIGEDWWVLVSIGILQINQLIIIYPLVN